MITTFLPAYLILAAFGLVISLCMEQSQIVAKTRGAVAGKIATGYMSAMKIMIVNRMGTIIYMFFLSLSIDIGITNRTLLTVAILSCLGVLVYNIFLVTHRTRILLVTKPAPNERVWNFLVQGGCRYSIASYGATLCNILGLTLPLLLANTFPNYRLSMANTGFLLNVFFTLINVLILETRYAEILDRGSRRRAYIFSVKIFVTRALATVTAIVALISLWVSL